MSRAIERAVIAFNILVTPMALVVAFRYAVMTANIHDRSLRCFTKSCRASGLIPWRHLPSIAPVAVASAVYQMAESD